MRTKLFLILIALSCSWISRVAAQDAAAIGAAKKEGSVVWYTAVALPTATAIAHAFKQKYPGIEVEVHRTGSERVLQRIMQEAAAGIKNVDLLDTSDAGHFELLKNKGMLLRFTPQGVAGFTDGFKDTAGV
jgi:iron(III) transport system substrate-binding protein